MLVEDILHISQPTLQLDLTQTRTAHAAHITRTASDRQGGGGGGGEGGEREEDAVRRGEGTQEPSVPASSIYQSRSPIRSRLSAR